MERKIRSIFTVSVVENTPVPPLLTRPQADNHEDAKADSAALTHAGARLHAVLGPARNPWGSLRLIPQQNKVFGFYGMNLCLAGGFR